jgi:hypothetical protein
MGNPLLAGVYKEHAKTEDSMIATLIYSHGVSHHSNRFSHVLKLILEDENAKEKFQ